LEFPVNHGVVRRELLRVDLEIPFFTTESRKREHGVENTSNGVFYLIGLVIALVAGFLLVPDENESPVECLRHFQLVATFIKLKVFI